MPLQEVDIGLAADVGTLQRLPKVVGNNRYMIVHYVAVSYCFAGNFTWLKILDFFIQNTDVRY